ncbi:MAG TPA: MFS transporter [Polyangia bacterium]|jgi:predicted MFS family arabinose efflux permease
MNDATASPPPAIPGARGGLALLAVVTGVAVANLYYAQPLAAMMADSLHVGAGALGFALMLSQIGYALGMLLLVPLGDGRERRGLMVTAALASAVALLLLSVVPSYPALAAVSLILGFASCLPQMAVPFAVGLVPPEQRGHAIGVVMGGLLAGILLSRTASGVITSVVGWRATFALAAGLMGLTAAVIRLALPVQRPPQPLAWRTILASLFQVVRSEPILRRQAVVGAFGFAAFSTFWSTLSFHLARLGYGSKTAGLFGVIGVVGVAVAPIVGRLAGRVRPTLINQVGLAAVLAGFVVFGAGAHSLVRLGLGVVLLDAGVQASHLANQTIVFGLNPTLRNRLNAVYMVTYFVGGALGTAAAALAWERAGWTGVSILGAVLAACGQLPLLAHERRDGGAGERRGEPRAAHR